MMKCRQCGSRRMVYRWNMGGEMSGWYYCQRPSCDARQRQANYDDDEEVVPDTSGRSRTMVTETKPSAADEAARIATENDKRETSAPSKGRIATGTDKERAAHRERVAEMETTVADNLAKDEPNPVPSATPITKESIEKAQANSPDATAKFSVVPKADAKPAAKKSAKRSENLPDGCIAVVDGSECGTETARNGYLCREHNRARNMPASDLDILFTAAGKKKVAGIAPKITKKPDKDAIAGSCESRGCAEKRIPNSGYCPTHKRAINSSQSALLTIFTALDKENREARKAGKPAATTATTAKPKPAAKADDKEPTSPRDRAKAAAKKAIKPDAKTDEEKAESAAKRAETALRAI